MQNKNFSCYKGHAVGRLFSRQWQLALTWILTISTRAALWGSTFQRVGLIVRFQRKPLHCWPKPPQKKAPALSLTLPETADLSFDIDLDIALSPRLGLGIHEVTLITGSTAIHVDEPTERFYSRNGCSKRSQGCWRKIASYIAGTNGHSPHFSTKTASPGSYSGLPTREICQR